MTRGATAVSPAADHASSNILSSQHHSAKEGKMRFKQGVCVCVCGGGGGGVTTSDVVKSTRAVHRCKHMCKCTCTHVVVSSSKS
jgi:hypothetical protein